MSVSSLRLHLLASPPLRYGIALLAVVTAIAARQGLNSLSGEVLAARGTLYVAILLCAWFLDRPASLVALVLGGLIDLSLFLSGSLVLEHTPLGFVMSQALYAVIGLSIIVMSDAQRRALKAAEDRRRQLDAVLDALPLGVYIADQSGRVVLANRQSERIWHGQADLPETVDAYQAYRAWWTDTGEPLAPEAWALARALAHGEVSTGEIIDIERFDGTRGTILNSAAPVRDAHGAIVGAVAAILDITERRRIEQAMQENEARYRALWDATFDSKVLHQGGIILDVNRVFLQRFGLEYDEAIGASLPDLIAVEDSADIIREKIAAQEEATYEVRLRRGDGTEFEAEIRSKNLAYQQRHVRLAAIHDISERRAAERQALVAAEERVRTRVLANFVREISHDFRTPLATIFTSVYLLRRTTDAERQRERAEIIEQQAKRLNELLDRLLTMARLDSGVALEAAPVELKPLLQRVRDQVADKAEAKGIVLRVDAPGEPVFATGDEEELTNALLEIVRNAVQFTPDGGSIILKAERQDGTALVTVEDTGVGIEHEQLTRIFDRLYRVDTARGVDTGGIGIGLAIARKIVELHQGKIEAESQPGHGSRFSITLPAA